MLSFSIVDVVLIFFATYRLAMMLHHDGELGPSQILYRLKIKLGVKESRTQMGTSSFEMPPGPPLWGNPGSFQEALLCYFCNSPYIGFLLAVIYVCLMAVDATFFAQLILLPFAASGFTLLVAKYTEGSQ